MRLHRFCLWVKFQCACNFMGEAFCQGRRHSVGNEVDLVAEISLQFVDPLFSRGESLKEHRFIDAETPDATRVYMNLAVTISNRQAWLIPGQCAKTPSLYYPGFKEVVVGIKLIRHRPHAPVVRMPSLLRDVLRCQAPAVMERFVQFPYCVVHVFWIGRRP